MSRAVDSVRQGGQIPPPPSPPPNFEPSYGHEVHYGKTEKSLHVHAKLHDVLKMVHALALRLSAELWMHWQRSGERTADVQQNHVSLKRFFLLLQVHTYSHNSIVAC